MPDLDAPPADPTGSIGIRLTLFGYPAVAARARLRERSRGERVRRAALYGGGLLLFTPVVALIPPHAPWVLGALGFGAYLARSHLRGTYEVLELHAVCPACGQVLELKPGTRLRLPHGVTCFNCHRESILEQVPLDGGGASG